MLRILVGIIAVAIAALISIAYFDRPPSSPSTAPDVTTPQRNMPQTPVPPATPPTK